MSLGFKRLTSALHRGEQPPSRPGRFTPGKESLSATR